MAIQPVFDDLFVVTAISNPCRYDSRYRLYRDFSIYMRSNPRVKFYTIEIAFGDRPFEITDPFDPYAIRVRTWSEVWHKENALNLAISRLPIEAKYIAWIDADIKFVRNDWAEETINQLQHYHVVQMFQNAIDLGPTGEAMKTHRGFIYAWMKNGYKYPNQFGNPYDYEYMTGSFAHPGYCWASSREAIDHLGGLIDFGLLGSGDYWMAAGLVEEMSRAVPKGLSERFVKKLMLWQERSKKFIQKDVGYVPGTIFHYFHGKKLDRNYPGRDKLMALHQYDPDKDLKRDSQMLWQLTDNNPKLRDAVRDYFRARNEDGTEAV